MPGKKARGKHHRTRAKFRKFRSRRGKNTVTKLLREFPIGTRVQVNVDPAFNHNMPFSRYQGLTGQVIGKQGRAFRVRINKGAKPMHLVVMAAHLTRIQEQPVEEQQAPLAA